MKFIFANLLMIIVVLLNSCSYSPKEEKVENEKVKPIKLLKPFFHFDEVEHFSTGKNSDLIFGKNVNEKLRKFASKIYVFDSPESLIDTTFIDSLKLIGFKSRTIEAELHDSINYYFSEREVDSDSSAACIPQYRDILIFRKNNKIIGIAKLCFSCMKQYIIGSEVDIEPFGQSSRYNGLQKLLYPDTLKTK